MSWTQLPQTSETDNAMRRAAALVCGCGGQRPHDPPNFFYFDGGFREFLPDQNRDDLARVFAAAREHPNNGAFGPEQERVWFDAVDQPRTALAQLLDLLQIPVPAQ